MLNLGMGTKLTFNAGEGVEGVGEVTAIGGYVFIAVGFEPVCHAEQEVSAAAGRVVNVNELGFGHTDF